MIIDDDVAGNSDSGGGGGGGLTFVTQSAGGSAGGYKLHNPHYLRLGYLRSLEQFVTTLGDYGLLVMLDMHAATAGVWPDDGKEHAPANLKKAWATLTRIFCDPVKYWIANIRKEWRSRKRTDCSSASPASARSEVPRIVLRNLQHPQGLVYGKAHGLLVAILSTSTALLNTCHVTS